MRGTVISRVRIAAAVAIVSTAAITALVASSPPARAGAMLALSPDLVTMPIGDDDLLVERHGGKLLLRLSNEVGNVGLGPLEMFPSVASANCDGDGEPANDRDASQRIYADADGDGAFTAGVDGVGVERRFGCVRYHPAHDHWHVLEFAAYELRREPRPGVPGSGGRLVAGSRKVGFCVTDNRRAFPGPAAPTVAAYPVYPGGNTGCDSESIQGLSVGWADIYVLALPGQQLEITDLPGGRYCIVSTVDPANLLAEANEANNTRGARISLRPSRLSVRRLRGPCRAVPR
jgi:hypothetical protein